MSYNEVKLLGTKINPAKIAELHDWLKKVISAKDSVLFISLNLHGLYLQFVDETLRKIQNKAVVRVDGMPIVWLAKLLGHKRITSQDRVTWMDWKDHFFNFCNDNQYSVFYIGSKPELELKIADYVHRNYQKIKFQNTNGYFKLNSEKEEETIKVVNEFKPDILLVGMGMPRQEKWCYKNLDKIHAYAVITCGAAMEYIVGEVHIPPRWMGRLGLEWFYRFVENPKRFFFRYFIEPWHLLYFIMKFKLRK